MDRKRIKKSDLAREGVYVPTIIRTIYHPKYYEPTIRILDEIGVKNEKVMFELPEYPLLSERFMDDGARPIIWAVVNTLALKTESELRGIPIPVYTPEFVDKLAYEFEQIIEVYGRVSNFRLERFRFSNPLLFQLERIRKEEPKVIVAEQRMGLRLKRFLNADSNLVLHSKRSN
jgi:hypothetical protein